MASDHGDGLGRIPPDEDGENSRPGGEVPYVDLFDPHG